MFLFLYFISITTVSGGRLHFNPDGFVLSITLTHWGENGPSSQLREKLGKIFQNIPDNGVVDWHRLFNEWVHLHFGMDYGHPKLWQWAYA